MLMKEYLVVGCGSLVGGCLRYSTSLLVLRCFGVTKFPFATLLVNIVGCFMVGLVAGYIERGLLSQLYRIFIITGLLGGFTTFSAFGLESVLLLRTQNPLLALVNITLTVFLCLLAVHLGMRSIESILS